MTAEHPRPLVAGNWKMNGLTQGVAELEAVANGVAAGDAGDAEVLICPPFTLIARFAAAAAGQHIKIGGQDCHAKPSGAHTGDIAAEMLKDCGASYVIVGHSERRTDHGETDAVVKAKAQAALRAGLTAIVCIGETREERETGKTLDVVGVQLAGSLPEGANGVNTVIAYEPVWAIGTGLTPTSADVREVHAFIRGELGKIVGEEAGMVRILYGGSCKPSNASELMGIEDVDGALVGGASLKAEDFLGIARAFK